LDIVGFQFLGPLAFLATFASFMNFAHDEPNPDAASNPNAPKTVRKGGITLSISQAGVKIGYELDLPPLTVGIFSLSNISFSAGCLLPFTDSPMQTTFGFASKQAPFLLTISIFGGQGYFALEWITQGAQKGVTRLEACLEFGGILTIDLLGLVKGKAYAVGGVYYLKNGDADTQIKVYFRFGGYVSLLGMVTVTLDVYLGLEYRSFCTAKKQTTEFFGTAQVTFSIQILFFSWSFTATFEKTFSGSTQKVKSCPAAPPQPVGGELLLAGGPSAEAAVFAIDEPEDAAADVNADLNLAALMTPAEWKDYWEAFAA
jgi:hypothetical protein